MPAVKLQIYVGPNDGTESCDYRGEKFIGSEHDPRRPDGNDIDLHRTVAESDPADEELLALVEQHGTTINTVLKHLDPARIAPIIAEVVGDFLPNAGLRIGLFDE